ncbi:MAG: transglutaminase-like domain-containing protein [Gammaproteobacteria bacterium]|nr:transglutaminase-like domain-containing protein [Gammaproteobacteria bacterium]
MIDYYSTQSSMTCPGPWAHLIEHLPNDLERLTKIVRCLIRHFADARLNGETLATERLAEMDLRCVKKMLTQIVSLSSFPLSIARSDIDKLTGCCRDFSVLVCSILRHHKIPARIRFGFSTIHIPGFHHDQTLLEYWHAKEKRWCLVDARADEKFIQRHQLKNFSTIDVPRNLFMSAAQAWRHCRRGDIPPQRIGSFLAGRMSGLWFIRNKLIQDIAALNKMEMLQWDCWGVMLENAQDSLVVPEQQVLWLDGVAETLLQSHDTLSEVQDLYRDSRIAVPQLITTYSVALGKQTIDLYS